MSAIAKITSKGQTTIPQAIREALAVGPGDLIEWEITGEGRAEVRRIAPVDEVYLRALNGTLGEWETTRDDEAYRDL